MGQARQPTAGLAPGWTRPTGHPTMGPQAANLPHKSSGAAAKGEGCLRVRGERDGLCENKRRDESRRGRLRVRSTKKSSRRQSGVPGLIPNWSRDRAQKAGVGTSADAARTSARATWAIYPASALRSSIQ
jgi:hypothetical protein